MAVQRDVKERIFWTTITISFVLLVHNGTEPLFIVAMAGIPLLVLLFLWKKSLVPLIFYLLLIGAAGRYTRYFRETYASDTLLAIRDYIGYFLAGKHVYKEMVMAQRGLTPFTYLPFSLFWYLPVQIAGGDLRFFEMIISSFVPLLYLWIGRLSKNWEFVPGLAIIALTPFLLDLSADGSNDNSAIFLLLIALVLFVKAIRFLRTPWWIGSAVILGLAASFKHYVVFYLIFFLPYLWRNRHVFPMRVTRYFAVFVLTISIVMLPFIVTAPAGFFRSLQFIELTNWHTTWGWNVWVAIRDAGKLTFSRETMWLVRTTATGVAACGFLFFLRWKRVTDVTLATAVTLLIYLVLSNWTTYAYFTFLIPLLAISALDIDV